MMHLFVYKLLRMHYNRPSTRGDSMKLMQYTYNFEPDMYRYILSSNILNRKKHEDKIFKELVQGYDCKHISRKYNYSVGTICNRQRDIYNKTKKYMS